MSAAPQLDVIYSARRGVAVTENETTSLEATRGVYVGGAGDLYVCFADAPSASVALIGVPAGVLLTISIVKVLAASTASSIVALY